MSGEAPRRINITTDRKRWWPKTIYHTYWSRVSYLVQKNNTCFFIVCLLVMSLGGYLFMVPSSNYNKTEMALRLFKEKMIMSNNNAPDILITSNAPHQEKLIMSSTYPPADTYLDWNMVYNITSISSNKRVKAALVVVTQERDMFRLRKTMVTLEQHFNQREKYPWIILSDKLFSNEFRHWISHTSQAPVFFGQIPSIEWQEPYWIDPKIAENNIKEMVKNLNINHGESMSWRRMTRYNMGFIAHHSLLKDLEYYWKVQPGSQYHCDIENDPFVKMKKNGHKLSFELTLTENHENIKEFHETVERFMLENKSILQPADQSIFRGLLDHASRHQQEIDKNDPLGEYRGHFSNCMIYNNFAIYSLKYLRSPEYTKFFDYLDQSGGFFYHKWGDAIPQSFAAGLFLKRSEITFGDVPGYVYDAGSSCPIDLEHYSRLKCTCTHNDYKVKNMRFCSPQLMKAALGVL